jgi:hydroxycarboxylate dehydrogenase B
MQQIQMQKIQASELATRVAALFVAAGTDAPRAQTVASNLVMANLSGHDSHGVGMAPRYCDAIAEGYLKPQADMRVITDAGAMLGLDAQCGYGQVVGEQAMHLAFERVEQHGSCIMSLAGAHHLGRIGHFAEMAVEHGYVALHFVSVWARAIVAPTGGGDGRFGTNPCCIGIPVGYANTQREPFVLDFATSRVAQGKMRVAYNEGRLAQPGTLLDENGQPTNDPSVVVVPQSDGRMGALLPFGDYKGYGLAVACELLGGALSGGGTWHHVYDGRRAVLNSMLTILIDPQRLGTQMSFAQETLAFIDSLRQSPATSHEGVMLAGEPERQARQERHRDGICVDAATWEELQSSAKKLGHVF